MGLDYVQQNTRIQMFFFKNYPSVISISRVRHAKKQIFRQMPKKQIFGHMPKNKSLDTCQKTSLQTHAKKSLQTHVKKQIFRHMPKNKSSVVVAKQHIAGRAGRAGAAARGAAAGEHYYGSMSFMIPPGGAQ